MKMKIVAAVLAAGVMAQSPPASAQGSADCTAALTDDCLSKMLTDLGLAPKPLSKGFLVTVKQDSWTIYVQAVLSGNGAKLGLNANLGVIEAANVSASQWEALLEANGDIDPSNFYYDKDRQKLYLHRSFDNRHVTPAILRDELDRFVGNIRSTEKLYAFTH
jgi:hypothetical protein